MDRARVEVPTQHGEHFPVAERPEPYVRICPFCKKDLTGLCLVLKTPDGNPVLVAEPCKCRFCGRYLLYGQKQSPIVKP